MYITVLWLALCLLLLQSSCGLRSPGRSHVIAHNSISGLSRNALKTQGASTSRVSAVRTPEEAWRELGESGNVLSGMTKWSVFLRAIAAGIFVGFGGLLSASVGFDMGGYPWEEGMGIARMLSGVFGFPLSIVMMTITGNGAWTGDALSLARAVLKKRTTLNNALRTAFISYIGCLVGVFAVAALAVGSKLPALHVMGPIVANRMTYSTPMTFYRGIGGGSLICLAIFLTKCATNMSGKAIGIILPISSYVIIGFEHYLASAFFFSTAFLNGYRDPNFTLLKAARFLSYATLGNFVGGALLVGCGLSSIPQTKKAVEEIEFY